MIVGGMFQRMRRALRSTSVRLALAVAACFLLAFVLLGGGVQYAVSALLMTDAREVIRADAAGLVELYRDNGLDGLREEIGDRVDDPDDPDAVYALIASDGRILAGTFSRVPARIVPIDDGRVPTGSAHAARWVEFIESGDDGRQHVVARVQQLADGTRLLTGLRTHNQDRFLALMWRAALFALLVAAAFGALIGWLLTRWVSHRLRALDNTASRVGAGELALRAPLDGSDDAFDRLARRFNAMLDRIEELLAGVRHATDHIAHDLRTPLTRLRNRLEEVRAEPARQGELLNAAIVDTDQLLQSFASLLRLARIEEQPPVHDEPLLDLAAVVRDAVELYQPIAQERGIAFDLALDPATVRGDTDQLFQMLVNLLDNAVKYAPSGSTIDVRLEALRDTVAIAIGDHGGGIPEADRERVFDRFQRLEEHRSSPGSGLGLSLVRAIAVRHGGTVRLSDNAPGLRVVVELPRVAERPR